MVRVGVISDYDSNLRAAVNHWFVAGTPQFVTFLVIFQFVFICFYLVSGTKCYLTIMLCFAWKSPFTALTEHGEPKQSFTSLPVWLVGSKTRLTIAINRVHLKDTFSVSVRLQQLPQKAVFNTRWLRTGRILRLYFSKHYRVGECRCQT